jgi:putative peptide zinc metalloprotease protein
MSEPLFSGSWYRVASLKPRLRGQARIGRHRYRGETWYVLHDAVSGQVHRFSAAGCLVIGMMDGRRTVQEIWESALDTLGDDAPTQEEMIRLLGQLHGAEVLQCDVSPDTAELFQRHERRQRSKLLGQLMSPMWWRVPLLDPDRLLTRLLPWARPLFGPLGALLWLPVVGAGVVLAGVHWSELTTNLLDRLLLPQNLLLLWCSFAILKIVHELGHGLAARALGGEVHDMGVMFLVFSPLPYVDASAASTFPEKWHRALVGAAGMLAELFLAALALFVWVGAEPGLIRSLAFNAVLVAGVSTILFNANPLLRYDGYYILADLLEIPNLYTRSRSYLAYLCERYLFGRKEAEPPPSAGPERAWFLTYAVASFLYRLLVVFSIALWVLEWSFYLGLLLTVPMVVAWFGVPLMKIVRHLATGPALRRVRVRAITVSTAVAALLIALIGFAPVPSRTRAEGVVWIPEEAFVRAAVDGFVERVTAKPGDRVRPGEVLVEARDPVLESRLRVLTARLAELRARHDAERSKDLVRAAMVREEMQYTEAELGRVREQLAMLTVRSRTEGTFVAPSADDLPGRLVKRGELLGHVVKLDRIIVRTIVPQTEIDLVRQRTGSVQVRLSERLDAPLPARLVREVPAASEQLPSPALGAAGGGAVPVDPRNAQGLVAMGRLFQVDLELPSSLQLVNAGGRVYVRFDHGWEPLAAQWARQLRQLFLARLNV